MGRKLRALLAEEKRLKKKNGKTIAAVSSRTKRINSMKKQISRLTKLTKKDKATRTKCIKAVGQLNNKYAQQKKKTPGGLKKLAEQVEKLRKDYASHVKN